MSKLPFLLIQFFTSSLKFTIIIAGLAILVTGCVMPQGISPTLNTIASKKFSELVKEDIPETTSVIAIVVIGAEKYPLTYWLNNGLVGTQYQGFFWLPVLPDTHRLRFQQLDKKWPPISVPTRSGQITYVVIDNKWLTDGPYKVGSREKFDEDLKERSGSLFQVLPSSPVEAYLPAAKRALIERCNLETVATTCQPALSQIPETLISPARRSKILATIDQFKARKLAAAQAAATAAAARSAAAKATTKAEAASVSKLPAISTELPTRQQRDLLMARIGDLFKTEQEAKALPYFTQLDALPIPIDPTTNFYWAKALFASGDRTGAHRKIVRFIDSIDPWSPYYQPALSLLTKITR